MNNYILKRNTVGNVKIADNLSIAYNISYCKSSFYVEKSMNEFEGMSPF